MEIRNEISEISLKTRANYLSRNITYVHSKI